MTLVFPRDLPSTRVSRCRFELERADLIAPTQGGALQSVQVAWPLWRMEIEVRCPSEATWDTWTTWADSLAAQARSFYAYDMYRPLPRHYRAGFAGLTRAGGGAFDGTAAAWSVDTAREVLTLTGLPAGFRLSPRDYVGFSWGGGSKRALVRVLEDIAAGGSGEAAWTVAPGVPTVVPADAVATVNRPTGVFKIVPGTLDADREGKTRDVSFEALQVLRWPA